MSCENDFIYLIAHLIWYRPMYDKMATGFTETLVVEYDKYGLYFKIISKPIFFSRTSLCYVSIAWFPSPLGRNRPCPLEKPCNGDSCFRKKNMFSHKLCFSNIICSLFVLYVSTDNSLVLILSWKAETWNALWKTIKLTKAYTNGDCLFTSYFVLTKYKWVHLLTFVIMLIISSMFFVLT